MEIQKVNFGAGLFITGLEYYAITIGINRNNERKKS